jgi:hypothetical protein
MGLFYIKPTRMPNIKSPGITGFEKLDAAQRPKLLKIPLTQKFMALFNRSHPPKPLFLNKNQSK